MIPTVKTVKHRHEYRVWSTERSIHYSGVTESNTKNPSQKSDLYWQQVFLLEVVHGGLRGVEFLQIMAQLYDTQTFGYAVPHIVCVVSDVRKAHQLNSKQRSRSEEQRNGTSHGTTTRIGIAIVWTDFKSGGFSAGGRSSETRLGGQLLFSGTSNMKWSHSSIKYD